MLPAITNRQLGNKTSRLRVRMISKQTTQLNAGEGGGGDLASWGTQPLSAREAEENASKLHTTAWQKLEFTATCCVLQISALPVTDKHIKIT